MYVGQPPVHPAAGLLLIWPPSPWLDLIQVCLPAELQNIPYILNSPLDKPVHIEP